MRHTDTGACEHRDELISVLYGEATERETAQFEQHLRTCTTCQGERLAFERVRESIGAWKTEALAGATQPQVKIAFKPTRQKSAVAALREFFELSPMWLKAATAFATLLFFVLAGLAFGRLTKQEAPVITKIGTDKVYTEQEKDQIVKRALDEQKASQLAAAPKRSEEIIPVKGGDVSKSKVSRPTQAKSGRRPLTKWERQQLAADLRLLERPDDDGLQLLSEPINR